MSSVYPWSVQCSSPQVWRRRDALNVMLKLPTLNKGTLSAWTVRWYFKACVFWTCFALSCLLSLGVVVCVTPKNLVLESSDNHWLKTPYLLHMTVKAMSSTKPRSIRRENDNDTPTNPWVAWSHCHFQCDSMPEDTCNASSVIPDARTAQQSRAE